MANANSDEAPGMLDDGAHVAASNGLPDSQRRANVIVEESKGASAHGSFDDRQDIDGMPVAHSRPNFHPTRP